MKEETPQIGGRHKLADLFDTTPPAQQRRGPQRGALMAMLDRVEPVPQALVGYVPGWPFSAKGPTVPPQPTFERVPVVRLEAGWVLQCAIHR